ncbi:MAG: hypothetical protein ACRYG5_06665 [Janthinobacterium lividum]
MDDDIDFVIYGGADWAITAFIQNPQCPIDQANPLANPVNLRGCSATLTAAISPGAPTKLFVLSSTDGSLVIDAPAGSIAWDMAATQTAQFVALPFPTQPSPCGPNVFLMGSYEMKVIDSGGHVIHEFSGKLYLSPGI